MILSYKGLIPKIDKTVFIGQGSQIIGDVELAKYSNIWFNCVLRGDVHYIKIGEGTNIQDGSILHTTTALYPINIGKGVTVGHTVTLHGCTIEDYALIGMGAILLDGCKIGEEALIAAGSLVREGQEISPRVLVAGIPAKIKRELSKEEITHLHKSAENYIGYAKNYLGTEADIMAGIGKEDL